MRRIWREWRLIDKVRSGTPFEVESAIAEANDPNYVSGYGAWVMERREWAEGLIEKGELKRGETKVRIFRGYRYQIKVGNRGGMTFKSLGKVT